MIHPVAALSLLSFLTLVPGISSPVAGQTSGTRPPTQPPPPQSPVEYTCPPCGCRGDDATHNSPGNCPNCGMEMIDKSTTLTISGIPNFSKPNDSVWTGGQPTLAQLEKLKEAGVRTVINLRMPEEHDGHLEMARVKELGMRYVNIPVDYSRPDTADVTAFLRATDTTLNKGRVFIHCTAAIRVGAFWMIRRIVRDGVEAAQAREEARTIGLGNQQSWVDFATKMAGAGSGKR